jgi:hypothetical protein
MLTFTPELRRVGFPIPYTHPVQPSTIRGDQMLSDEQLDRIIEWLFAAVMFVMFVFLPYQILRSSMQGLPQPAEYTVEVER